MRERRLISNYDSQATLRTIKLVQSRAKNIKNTSFACSPYSAQNTSLLLSLIQVDQAFGRFLLKVDLKMEMVDQDIGDGRPLWSTA